MRSPQATYAQAHHNLLSIFYFRILHKEHSGFPPFVLLDIGLIKLAFSARPTFYILVQMLIHWAL